uniref:Zinc finger, CCHC-type n=1 Tax=Tanacetum cinerariifolium TaxID=118510 RepID=A0A6L2NR22_TANCI|nr:zinc finger, CCHC-type [Tanacetum cinerariifolium]
MNTERCKTCMLTKITKKPFQNVKRKTGVLELIHSDLCDLHATPSLRNKKYFMTFINDASRFCYVYLLHTKDEALDKFKVFKTEVELQQWSLIKRFRTDRGEHSKAFRFYVIKPNDSVAINSIIESRDAIFDEHRFSFVPRPSQKSLKDRTEDSGVSVIPEKVIDEVVQLPEFELRKSIRQRTPKDFGPKFQLYLIEGTRDEKEAINDEMDSIMGNNTWVLTDLPPSFRPLGWMDYFDTYAPMARISTIRLLIAMASIHNLIIHQMNVKIAFLNRELEVEVDLIKEFLSSRFSMKDIGEADIILGIRIKHESNGIAISQSHYIEKVLKKFNYSDCTPVSTLMDTCEKPMPNKGPVVSQLEYSRVIGCLMYAMTCTSNSEDNSSTSGWVFLLGGGAISLASKKQTYITGSTIESEFVALAAAGKEVEWLKNLHLEIPLYRDMFIPVSGGGGDKKFIHHSIDECPYAMKKILGTNNQDETTQKKDLTGDELKQYEADIEAINLILISIPNDVYNSVDACQNARDIWNKVKRLMQSTKLSKADKASRFVNEFDKFTTELGEYLSFVYNRFSQLINDMDKTKSNVTNNQYQVSKLLTGRMEQNDFLLADAAPMEDIKELSANICMMATIQKAYSDSEDGPSYDSAFISKEVNDGKVEHDKNANDAQDNTLELLARNAYKEAQKQQLLAKKNDNLDYEIEKVKKESIKAQKNSLKRVKIIEYDF